MVRFQKTWASWMVAPTMAWRNWRAVYSTSGNSGISSVSMLTQALSQDGSGHLTEQEGAEDIITVPPLR